MMLATCRSSSACRSRTNTPRCNAIHAGWHDAVALLRSSEDDGVDPEDYELGELEHEMAAQLEKRGSHPVSAAQLVSSKNCWSGWRLSVGGGLFFSLLLLSDFF